jgi:hypothetical protein
MVVMCGLVNMVETWLGIIARQAIRRGTFTSLRHLILKIHDYFAYWNTDAKPFEWTATPQEIITKVTILQRDSQTARQQLQVK